MEFSKQFLKDMVYNAVYDEITDTSRWSEDHEIVFEHEGKFYRAFYSCGKTEMQDQYPFDDLEDDESEFCYEVEEKEVLVKQWVVKK